jgi:cobalt/nickel transport system permease protein
VNPFPIDAYAYANRLRWAHPAEKILFAGLTIAICLGSGSPIVAALGFLVATLAVTGVARIGLGAFWYFVRLPIGFIAISVVTMAFATVPPDGSGALLSLPVGPWRVGITAPGLLEGGRIFAVSLACVASSLFLALTTPMVDLADQLRRWRVPALFVELMTLVYRFIFVLIETAHTMHLAQEARLGYCTAGRSLRSVGMLASNLYLRANARGAALFTALSARGYTGDLHVLREQPHWSRRNLALIAAADGLLLLAAVGLALSGLGGPA